MDDHPAYDPVAISLFSEIATCDQLMNGRLSKALPRGMALSHFTVLDYLMRARAERTPAQLAKTFHVTKAAMTNTLRKLEDAGYIHVRPDWDDARRKMVAISPSGRQARDAAIAAITPMVSELISDLGEDKVRASLPVLRELRSKLEPGV